MQVSGGIFGELDFFLRHPRSFAAVSSTDDCTIQVLNPRGGGV
jgi:CRP-like cAMP-binding protein